MSRDIYRYDVHKKSCTVSAMLDLDLISSRIEKRLDETGLSASGASLKAGFSDSFVRDFLRGAKKDVGVIALHKLGVVLGTSVAYLIGETDDASAIPHIQPSSQSHRMTVRSTSAAPTYDPIPASVVSLETDQRGELIFLLTEEDSRMLHGDLEKSFERLAEERLKKRQSALSS